MVGSESVKYLVIADVKLESCWRDNKNSNPDKENASLLKKPPLIAVLFAMFLFIFAKQDKLWKKG